jgi:hypothetical protein
MTNAKREKFIELAEKRTNKAIKAIRLIGNLSNRHFYEYEEREIRLLVKTLETELASMKARFESNKPKAQAEFKLR